MTEATVSVKPVDIYSVHSISHFELIDAFKD
jgi:hypothetical protein